jgi:hypothetical protein
MDRRTVRRYTRAATGSAFTLEEVLEDAPSAAWPNGGMGIVRDDETGERRVLHALVITSSSSRHMFVWPTFGQMTGDVCAGLEAAWRFFGATARSLLPDNCSAMLAKPDAHEPKLVPAFAEYVQARHIFVDPDRSYE